MKGQLSYIQDKEILQDTKNHTISVRMKREIIATLNTIFKSHKMRSSGWPLLQRIGYGHGKKTKKALENRFLKGPFDGYTFGWDCWDAFLQNVFSTMRSHFLKRVNIVHGTEKPVARYLELETEEKDSALVSQYLDTTESLMLSWIRFINNPSSEEEIMFPDFGKTLDTLNLLYKNPIFSIIDLQSHFHSFFLEYVTTLVLAEKDREKTDLQEKNQKLSQQVERLIQEKIHTTATLRLATQDKVHHTTTNTSPTDIKSHVETREENNHLKSVLQELWYDLNNAIDPKEWLQKKAEERRQDQESQWENIAMEESERVRRLEQDLSKQTNYISYLENRLNNTSGDPQGQYQKEQWNSWTMDLNDMMVYASQNPEVGEIISPHVIRCIDCCVSKIGGSTLSSTNNSGVWVGSGHICNIVLKPLLHFMKDRIEGGEYKYLTLSWKEVAEKYMESAWWEKSQGSSSTFHLLLKKLSDEPGNITNIRHLLDWMRAMEEELRTDYKKLCEIISDLFEEKMGVLHRQILAEKDKITE